jgi:hypothetical protein
MKFDLKPLRQNKPLAPRIALEFIVFGCMNWAQWSAPNRVFSRASRLVLGLAPSFAPSLAPSFSPKIAPRILPKLVVFLPIMLIVFLLV